MESLLPLIILLPIIGSAIVGLTGFSSPSFRQRESLVGGLATLFVAIPFFIVLYAFMNFHGEPIHFTLFSWMKVGNLDISFGYTLDQLSLLMAMIVNGVGALIHMYSVGYMHGDKGFYKFFAYLNLFIFAMNNLILGDNLVVLFLGWEGVGVCSYLLIGFWYEDMEKAKAAQKAFVANRIGDFALIVAMMLIFSTIGSLRFVDILSPAGLEALEPHSFWIALLVFIAATGKSAQIPLYVWLPDAMAGPTPVSALIHAATMVTSGIYLITRIHPIFLASPEVMVIVVIVAALTSVVAALIAVAQNDIKKVLAYSTVSQLGFMFMALGAGAFTTAIFHVMTHAFFKACLFLGSGSVIHAMEHMHTVEDPQDIRTMGGLRKYMPSTARTFWISTLAIAGIPLLSGFFSKDEILATVFFNGFENSIYFVVWVVATLTAALTAFYMTRVTYLTFEGEERFPSEKHPHESPWLMTTPLWILAFLAIFGGYVGVPTIIGHEVGVPHVLNETWLSSAETAGHGGEHDTHADGDSHSEEGDHGEQDSHADTHEKEGAHSEHTSHAGLIQNSPTMTHAMHEHHALEWILLPLSAVIAVGMVFLTFRWYRNRDLAFDETVKMAFGDVYQAMENKFYVDEFYNRTIIRPFVWAGEHLVLWFDKNIIDGVVNGVGNTTQSIGSVFRRLQTGLVQNYALVVSIGVVVILAYLLFG